MLWPPGVTLVLQPVVNTTIASDMKGSYINIWITKGAKSKVKSEGGGFENPTFHGDTELVSLGFAPIEDRVDELLARFGIVFVTKTESEVKGCMS